MMLMTDCDDKWDEHYNQDNFDLPDINLKEYIEQNAQTSIFYNMLKATGYDELLSSPQSYTVWAPENDALAGIDLTNTDLVTEIVKNHVTRGKISTSDLSSLNIRMLNGKFVEFAMSNSEYTFGKKTVTNADGIANNGFVHILKEYVPTVNNLWRFIEKQEGLDSLYKFLYGQTTEIFDPIKSKEIGVNSDGQVVYDTFTKNSNPVFEKLGHLEIEDSTYTVIMPNNSAWIEAYNRIEGYFNFPNDGGGPERQHLKTQFTLIQDMIFRGRFEEPVALNSMISTNGNTYNNPGQLFSNVTETYNLSNGIANITTQMPFSDTSSWFKEIRVEAENLDDRTNSNNVVYSRISYGSGLDISNNEYVLVDPTSSYSTVEFSIPNTLSATYNIYCVFVPGSLVDNSDYTPTKVKFELTYIRRSSGSTFFKEIIPDINTTYPVGLTKMFVDQFDFQYANIIDDEHEKISVKLKVINDVTSAEQQAGEYTRTMRIDCIILEPVF
jgi:hypothetical protein